MSDKKIYWKDMRQAFTSSLGRFLSIFSLMMIGAIALIALKVTGPNLEQSAQNFIDDQNMFDLAVMSEYGITEDDLEDIKSLDGSTVEAGYFTDLTEKDTTNAVRVFSKPDKISQFEVIDGELPSKDNEIALAPTMQDDYDIGDEITFEQINDNNQDLLKGNTYKVTGFVNSSEIWDNESMGSSNAGSGELSGYGVVTPDAFDSEEYTIARLRVDDLRGKLYTSDEFSSKQKDLQKELEDKLADNGERRLNDIKSDIQDQIDDGKSDVKSAKKELKDNESKIKDAESKVEDGEKAVEAGLIQDPNQISELEKSKKDLDKSKKEFNDKKSDAESEIKDAEADIDDAEKEKDDLEEPEYTVYTPATIPGSDGYSTYDHAATAISSIGNIFPVVLYIVAAMVTFMTMTRFVDEERQHAGLFKALGYTNNQIIAKFVLYGLISSFLGTIVGILIGNYFVAPMIADVISQTTVIGETDLFFYPTYIIMTLVLALISAVLPAYLIARRELSKEPAFLMRPKPPVTGSNILLERISFIWERMSFTQKVTARNIFRYKQRMLMTIFGVAGAVALLFGGLGIRSSIAGVSDSQFGEIFKYDLIAVEAEDPSQDAKDEVDDLLNSDRVKEDLPVYQEATSQSIDGVTDDQDVTVIATGSDDFDQFVKLHDRDDDEKINLSDDGIVISEKLADLYDVEPGDNITFKLEDKDVEAKVADVTEMYTGHFIYMTDDYYEELTDKDFDTNAYLITLDNSDSDETEELSEEFLSLDGIQGVVQNTGLVKVLDSISGQLESVMLILIVISILLGVVILYNLTNINVAERKNELSTIKVLGFHSKEVTMYIYRETIILSIVGILVGLVAGRILHLVLLDVIGNEEIIFDPTVTTEVWATPIIAITLIIIVLGFLVYRRMKRINMLDAL